MADLFFRCLDNPVVETKYLTTSYHLGCVLRCVSSCASAKDGLSCCTDCRDDCFSNGPRDISTAHVIFLVLFMVCMISTALALSQRENWRFTKRI